MDSPQEFVALTYVNHTEIKRKKGGGKCWKQVQSKGMVTENDTGQLALHQTHKYLYFYLSEYPHLHRLVL